MRKIFFLPILFLLFGCSVTHMTVLGSPPAVNLKENESAIIFIRTNPLWQINSSPIAEIKGNDASFVGNLRGRGKILHVTTSGKHDFIVASSGAQGWVLKADLKPGMFYYVYVKLRFWSSLWRFWSDGAYALMPVASPDYNRQRLSKYIENPGIAWLGKTTGGERWFQAHRTSFITRYQAVISVYEATGRGRISTLEQDSGVSAFIQ